MSDIDQLFPATAMPDKDWWQALWPDPLSVLRKMGFKPGMNAIDLCCGDGLFTVPMTKLLDGRLYAVDLDQEMLIIAQKAVQEAGGPNCVWLTGDARDLVGLVSEKVDHVFIANTFHGVPDQTGLSLGVRDVLKPGGRFLIVNWHVRPREETPVLGKPRGPRQDMRMSPDDVRTVVEPAGFELVETVELPPYHYGAIFKILERVN